MKNGSNRGKTFENENKKKHVQKQMRINQKGKIDQKKKDKHAKHKYEKVPNKKRDRQTSFF